MTKLEILKQLSDAGVMTTYEKHPAWKKAFEFYWKETGDYNLVMGCGTCYRKLLEWLKK